jgi:thymidylate synthase (FAD)
MDNKVELLGYYGTDLVHAQSAWTSTSRDLSEDKLERVDKLLAMLASEGHHTPFEKSSLHFLVTVDQATHIHLLKHRVGVSINGESARYKELKEDKFYIPEDWKDLKTSEELFIHDEDSNGNEEGGELSWKKGTDWASLLQDYTEIGNYLYHNALTDLTPLIGRKRAKESARFFKTFNSQITMDVMFNWRSFAHFLKLRNSEHAQKEVRELAQQMLQIVKDIPGNPFEKTIKAFGL